MTALRSPSTNLWTTAKGVAAITFLIALTLRLVFVWQWYKTPYGDMPLLDAKAYDLWASSIAQGHWLRSHAFYQSPLYPYVLGILYRLFGHTYVAASLLNAVLGATTCALSSRLAYRLFGAGPAFLTGLLAALYRPFVFYSAPILKESLGLFLLSVFLITAWQALERPKSRTFILSGLTLGLCSLVRSNMALLGIAFLAMLFFRQRQKFLRHGVSFLAALALTILPATLHNAYVSRDFVPITYNGGFNFYIGHAPGANGANIYPDNISSDPVTGEERDTRRVAEEALGHSLRPSEISRYWFHQGFQFIAQNPENDLIRLVNKLWLAYDGNEHMDNYNIVFIAENFGTLLAAPLIGFGLISVLASFAAIALWKERRRPILFLFGFMFVYLLSILPFYVTDRYRLPLVVFLMPLAGSFVVALRYLVAKLRLQQMAYATAVACAFLWISAALVTGSPATDARHWGLLCGLESDAGKDREALAMLEKGLVLAPASVGEDALVKGALSADRLGLRAQAEQLIGLANRYYPTNERRLP